MTKASRGEKAELGMNLGRGHRYTPKKLIPIAPIPNMSILRLRLVCCLGAAKKSAESGELVDRSTARAASTECAREQCSKEWQLPFSGLEGKTCDRSAALSES
jgi:hypothetical protein